MVMDLGFAMSGHWSAVEGEISAVRREIPGTLKVIIESALLSPDAIVTACRVADAAGADFVKTSTGFHPAGGASVDAVRLMADTVGGRLGVKASGGIRNAEQALAMVDAGATRLGISATRAVIAGITG
jgi:deoxyribose-phosphate aldolase